MHKHRSHLSARPVSILNYYWIRSCRAFQRPDPGKPPAPSTALILVQVIRHSIGVWIDGPARIASFPLMGDHSHLTIYGYTVLCGQFVTHTCYVVQYLHIEHLSIECGVPGTDLSRSSPSSHNQNINDNLHGKR